MVAGAPLLDGVHGAHRDAAVEAPRGECVVELGRGGRRGLGRSVERRHVQGVARQTRGQRVRLPAGGELGTHELQIQRRHPVGDGAVAGLQRQPIVLGGALDHVEIARRW